MTEPATELNEEITDVETSDGVMAIIRKRPRDHPSPGVVMFHDGPGIRDASHVFARNLARLGYDVIVPDLYHRHGRMIGYEPHEREADPTLVDHLWKLLATLHDDEIQHDLDKAREVTGLGDRGPLGTIGFCAGARAVFRTMMRLPDLFVAGAMWHPSFLCDDHPDSPHHTAENLKGDLFIGIGADDQQQPVAIHQPFLDAVHNLDHVEIYPGADHGYTLRGWSSYNHDAATASLTTTAELFERNIG